ncbi:hypothetical protein [Mariprofundus erugo]|uniref:hypothetical protein n=1 Tax=Mariprofundus erugo TaxID=2528639 RepID=UPI001EE7B491|nr:hypothetical protein [Mariprofundus erugo]
MRLFYHPVGIFPAGARWYLATIAVLALLAIGMHLSVQQQAQQQAGQLILQWGRDAGVEIGDVRYHLLRNGLVLQQIRLHKGDDTLAIAHMLIHANPKLLTGSHPRIASVSVSGVDASLHIPVGDGSWLDEPRLLQLWNATRAFDLHDGRLNLYPVQGKGKGLLVGDISLSLKTRAYEREVAASAGLPQGGSLDASWLRRDSAHSQIRMNWQQVDAAALARLLGLKVIAGKLAGDLAWDRVVSDVAGQSGRNRVQGQMRLQTSAGSVRTHRLKWDVSGGDDSWVGDVDADAWPLRPWAEHFPSLSGRQLTAGHLDGALHWQGRPGAWHVSSDKGALYDLTYAAGGASAWYWSRVNYQQLSLDTQQRQLDIGSAELEDSRLVLDTARNGAAAAGDDGWQISMGPMGVSNMMLAFSLPHGKVMLAGLSGQGNWPEHGPLSFELDSADDADSDVSWHLQGRAERGQRALDTADFSVRGRNVPLQGLRALLPLRVYERQDASLAGQVDLDVTVAIRNQQWRMQGEAGARDFDLVHSGNTWSADHVNARFGPVGMGLPFQQIASLEATGWHYTGALQPLSATVQGGGTDASVRRRPWWVTALQESGCHIDSLHWQQGTFSVGQSDARWGENIDLEMHHIEPGAWAPTRIDGIAGGSHFTLQGEWDLLSRVERMQGRATIDHALPFFLHDWMRLSGMPALVRGRLSAEVSVDADELEPGQWHSEVTLGLTGGRFNAQETPSDPLLARTGYKTVELLAGLKDEHGVAALSFEQRGRWADLSVDTFGDGLLAALRDGMHEQHPVVDASMARERSHLETRIRLRDSTPLSFNERERLRKVVRKLRAHPDMVVNLRPEWTAAAMTEEELHRIQQSQKIIARYLVEGHDIAAERIFPIWSTAGEKGAEISSIRVETELPLSSQQPPALPQ